MFVDAMFANGYAYYIIYGYAYVLMCHQYISVAE